MGFAIDMPDANRGATLQQLYNWTYNGGSYGRKPSFNEIIEHGWGPALKADVLYWDSDNGDLRYRNYLRTITSIIEPDSSPARLTTTNDTPYVVASSDNVAIKLLTAYQSSGGPIDFIVTDYAGANVIYQQQIADSTWTKLDISDVLLGYNCRVKWSVPAGVTQYVGVQRYKIVQEEDTD